MVTGRTQAQAIEVFHLLFLRVLAANRADWFVLKGGANIRYFFDSPRYSNDIDLDFTSRQPWQVGESVEKILHGRALRALAEQAQVEVVQLSAPKQTDTTRRWKIGLRADGLAGIINTKIEFSGRPSKENEVAFDVIPDRVVRSYGLIAPTVRHYREVAAINQKVAALAHRSDTKARDVFDLDLLIRRWSAVGELTIEISPSDASQAAERTLDVSYANFTTEVAPFLDEDVAALYDEHTWSYMCESVVRWLTRVAHDGAVEGSH